jgi:hypothetical protein
LYTERLDQRNPHIRGVSLALRTIFGLRLDPSQPSREVLTTVDGEQFHMFDANALVNAVLCTCAATPASSST